LYSPVVITTSDRITDKPSRQRASTSGSFEISIRKFDGTNFNFWKELMQDYLIVRGQIEPIEHDTALATYKPEAWTKLYRVVRATIRMHLYESVYYTIQ
jgi:hypothetical protein